MQPPATCLELYRQHRPDSAGFGARYLRFIRDFRGGSPSEIIARNFGVGLDDPSALATGLALLEELVRAFEDEVGQLSKS